MNNDKQLGKKKKNMRKEIKRKEGPGPERDVAAGAGEHYKIKDRR